MPPQMPVDSKYFEQYEPDNDYFNQYEHEAELLASHEQTPSEIPNKINTLADRAKGLVNNEYFQRFLHGPSEKDLGGVKLNPEDADVPIPGVSEAGKYIERKLSNTGNYAAGFLGGLVGYGSDILSHPLGFAGPTHVPKVGSAAREVIPQTQKLLPRGQYTVNRLGEVYGGEQIPRQSMKESLSGKPDILTKPIKSEKVNAPAPKKASDYINAVKSGEVNPEEISFEDWQSQVPQESKVGPGHTEADHYLETLPQAERLKILGQFIDKFGADWPSKFQEWYKSQNSRPLPVKSSLPKRERPKDIDKLMQEGKVWEASHSYQDMLPQKAAATGGKIKIGADVTSLGKVLGSSLYQGDFPKVATKELLQNSIDATRHLGDKARIDIDFNEPSGIRKNGVYQKDYEGNEIKGPGFIRVRDNGNGMTRQELETVFTDLGASGKRTDVNAVGGFGLAKAAPLLGGEKVDVVSRVMEDGMLLEHSFSGTPEELLEGVPIATRKLSAKDIAKEAPDEFDSVTGTSVTTHFKPEQDTYYARQFVDNLVRNSSGLKGKIRINKLAEGEKVAWRTPEILQSQPVIGRTIKLGNEHAEVNLTVPSDAKYAERPGVMVKVLNNGMYQSDIRVGGYQVYPNIPDRVVVDVRSRVPEGDTNYPFTANREALRGTVQQMVEGYINDNIIKPGINARTRATVEAYQRMPEINGVHFYDVGNRFTPQEFNQIVNHPAFHGLAKDIQSLTQDLLAVQVNRSWSDKLERVGIIFDDKLYGIHIPNPAAGGKKSAILINPLQIMSGRTPDEAAAGLFHTMAHELAHVHGGGHDEEFAQRLAEIYTKYGVNNAITNQEILKGIISVPGTNEYLPEFQEFLSRYSESRGREAVIDDPLYRTGIGSRDPKSKGKGEIPSNPKSGPNGVDASVTKLLNAIAESKPLREEQEAIYSAERSKRFQAFMGVKEQGRAGAIKSLGKLKGEMEKVGGVELSDVDVDQLFNLVRNNARITPGEKARGYTALFKLLEGGNVPQRGELAILDRVFGGGFGQQIIQLHGGIGAVGLRLSKTANTMKTLNATLDFSAPFRQGLGLATRKEFYTSFAKMFQLAGSEKAFAALGDAIEAHPNFILSRDAGLFLADHSLGQYEEAFMNSYIGDLQEAGKVGKFITAPVRASERAYVGFLNKLRFDTFNNMLAKLEKQGYKAEEVAGPLAKYINVSTGRGELGRASKYADALNTVLFSPRLISSRLTILNPKYYVDAPDYLRKDAIRTLLGIAGFVAMADQVGSVIGGQLQGNSLSSDFGKIRFGKTRLDPGGGFLQYIVLASRLVQNKVETSANKTIDMSKGGFKDPNRWSLLFGDKNAPGFIENKGSPMATFISGMLRGKDFAGQPFDTKKELADRFTPLIIQDIRDVANSDPDLLPLGFPAAFGMGLQTYQTKQKGMSLSGPSMSMDLRP
jgi:hypothetical protein